MDKRILFWVLGIFLLIPTQTFSADTKDNWRQGRIYYRMVCTACHKKVMGEGVSPMTRTIAEWGAYIKADKHTSSEKGEATISHYTSKAYRESIKATNKAAEKYIDIPEEELLANVRAFLVHGAKDSDTPARCQ